MSIRNQEFPISKWVLAAAVVFGMLAPPALAQDWKGRGRVSGMVTATDGSPIKDAKVLIQFRGQEGVGPKAVETNKKGRWSYLGLSTAPYTVIVEAEGYIAAEVDIRVNEYPPSPPPPVEVTLRPVSEATDTSGESDRLMGLLEEGNQLMTAGQFAQARTKFEEVLGSVDDAAQRWPIERAVAGTYLEEGNTAEARTRFEALFASTESPSEKTQVLQSIARSYYVDENVDQSVTTLERALAIDPNDVGSLRLIVDILVAAGREADAEPYMARLPEGEKIDPNALLNLGITAYNGGDMDTALTKFRAVVDAYPDNADAQYYLGLVLMGQGQNAEAKSAFEKMLALAPDHGSAADAKQYLEYLGSL